MMVGQRQTAEERRRAVLAAAIFEFAQAGYSGSSTEAIAQRAGISQPYLFRLFGTKKDLFIATYNLVGERIVRQLTTAAYGKDGEEALSAMAEAYAELMQDPELLQVEMHGYAAATGDPDIAAACRRTFELLLDFLEDTTDVSEERIREFFAAGMLITVMSAIDLFSESQRWCNLVTPFPEKAAAIAAAARALKAQREGRTDLPV